MRSCTSISDVFGDPNYVELVKDVETFRDSEDANEIDQAFLRYPKHRLFLRICHAQIDPYFHFESLYMNDNSKNNGEAIIEADVRLTTMPWHPLSQFTVTGDKNVYANLAPFRYVPRDGSMSFDFGPVPHWTREKHLLCPTKFKDQAKTMLLVSQRLFRGFNPILFRIFDYMLFDAFIEEREDARGMFNRYNEYRNMKWTSNSSLKYHMLARRIRLVRRYKEDNSENSCLSRCAMFLTAMEYGLIRFPKGSVTSSPKTLIRDIHITPPPHTFDVYTKNNRRYLVDAVRYILPKLKLTPVNDKFIEYMRRLENISDIHPITKGHFPDRDHCWSDLKRDIVEEDGTIFPWMPIGSIYNVGPPIDYQLARIWILRKLSEGRNPTPYVVHNRFKAPKQKTRRSEILAKRQRPNKGGDVSDDDQDQTTQNKKSKI